MFGSWKKIQKIQKKAKKDDFVIFDFIIKNVKENKI